MKKKIFVAIIVIFVAGAISLIFLFRNSIFADQLRGDKVYENSISKDINQDGKSEDISVMFYSKNGKSSNYLTISGSKVKTASIKLSGFEDNVRFCEQSIYQFEADQIICVVGEVGVHSENLQFAKYKDGKISMVQFVKEGSSSPNIVSDVPKFSTSNLDSDQFFVDNRNYDLNPVNDAVQSIYKYQDGGFTFIESKDIVYSSAIE